MLYAFLRGMARIALRRYYAEVIVQDRQHIPEGAPLIVVANHPNALVDAMLIATAMRRRVFITARATLFEQRALSGFLQHAGVIPLLRIQDVPSAARPPGFLSRNDASRQRVADALHMRQAVLVFPEGTSHDSPTMVPLKSGAARIALQARNSGVGELQILPVGLIYEAKEDSGSRVLVRFGAPINVDAWSAEHSAAGPGALTREIARRLDRATLGVASQDSALRSIRAVRALTELRRCALLLNGLAASYEETEMVIEGLEHSTPVVQALARTLTTDVETFNTHLEAHGITMCNVAMFENPRYRPSPLWHDIGTAVLLAPFVGLGRGSWLIPMRVAQMIASYTLRSDPSRDQPAMRTILIGLFTVPAWFAVQATAIAVVSSGLVAVLWILVVLLAMTLEGSRRDRFKQIVRRVRAHRSHPSDDEWRRSAFTTLQTLIQRGVELEAARLAGSAR